MVLLLSARINGNARRSPSIVMPFAVLGLAVLISTALAPFADAGASLGSATGEREASIQPGGTARFKLYLFNSNSGPILYVSLSVEAPQGWDTAINPKSMELKPAASGEAEEGYEFIASGDEYIKAGVVTVTANAPSAAKTGTYSITARANAWESQGGITAAQERSFHFSVHVSESGSEPAPNQPQAPASVQKEIVINKSTTPPASQQAQGANDGILALLTSKYYIIIIVLVVIVVSVVLYKV